MNGKNNGDKRTKEPSKLLRTCRLHSFGTVKQLHLCAAANLNWLKKKNYAGSDDTASMIMGGGYVGARTRQPPTAQTIQKLMWVRGVVCRSTQTQTATVVACVILQCIPCFYECRCMSDGVFIQFVCQFFNLMVIKIKVRQRFICIVFVDSPHNSNKDHV